MQPGIHPPAKSGGSAPCPPLQPPGEQSSASGQGGEGGDTRPVPGVCPHPHVSGAPGFPVGPPTPVCGPRRTSSGWRALPRGCCPAGEDARPALEMLALLWRCSPSPARPSPAPSPCFPSSHTNPSPGGSLGAIGAPISCLGGYCTSQLVPYIERFPLSGCSESPAL